MSHLKRIQNLTQVSISLPADEDGFMGRECPACETYFKVKPGTGLPANNPCHCPYCGKIAGHDHFYTQDQIAYSQGVARNAIEDALHEDLKDFARGLNRSLSGTSNRGGLSISMKTSVKRGSRTPVRRYSEKELETKLVCERCTVHYAIYGAFAFCPDCGSHNSLQILQSNLKIVDKMLGLAETVEEDLKQQLVGDGLENAVAAFDGFGRECCRIHSGKSSHVAKAENLSFQNLAGAQHNVQSLFAFDLAAFTDSLRWAFVCRCFQKRHLLAHSMGVVDESYLNKTSDPNAVKGRKVIITAEEVRQLVQELLLLGSHLAKELETKS